MTKFLRFLYKLFNFDVMSIPLAQIRLAVWAHKKRKEENENFLNPEIDVAMDRSGRAVPTSHADITLRPTVLKRVLVTVAVLIGFPILSLVLIKDFPEIPMWAYPLVGGLAVLALIHFCTYELRYNRDQIIGRGMMFNRLDYRWADVQQVDIVDERTFHLVFENGERMQIYKSLQGVAEFVAFAQARVSQNRAAQPSTPEPKSGWAPFGSRKTFP